MMPINEFHTERQNWEFAHGHGLWLLSLSLRNFHMIAGKVVMHDSRLHNFWKKYRITELEKANGGKTEAAT
jgi:hypothetical protein